MTKIFLTISACDIPWWMALIAMLVPAIIAWFIASQNSKDSIHAKNEKIKQLQAELQKCYQEKQVISTKLVKPEVRFSDPPAFKGKAPGQSERNKPKSSSSTVRASKYPKLKNNLEVVEGIGPKMKAILNENGINTLAELASTSKAELKTMLNKYGDRYRIIDSTDWSNQAMYANTNRWTDLITHQEQNKKKVKTGKKLESKVAKLMRRYGYN